MSCCLARGSVFNLGLQVSDASAFLAELSIQSCQGRFIRMNTITLKNEPFLLRSNGDRACLLLHGLGGGVYEMQLLGEAIHRLGLTVCGINYPGHDCPSPKMPSSTWQEWFGHIQQAYEDLAKTYRKISLVGFSTGCPLALHLANVKCSSSEKESPAVIEHLVLLGPYLKLRYRWYFGFPLETYIRTVGQTISDLPRFSLPICDRQMEVAARQASFFQSFNLQAVRSAMELIETKAKPAIPNIHIPTLILQATGDSVVDPSGAQYLYDRLASTRKQLVWLTKSDHIVPLDVERETVFAEVTKFLS